VREALLGVVKFWLDRGVDGFRLDVFNVYFKSADFRDNPGKPGLRGFDRQQHLHDFDQPEMIPLLQDLRSMLDSYPERYAVGETFYSTPEKIKRYCRPDGLHATFNFEFTHAISASPVHQGHPGLAAIRMDEGIWLDLCAGQSRCRRMATRHARAAGRTNASKC
jgi:glycosidase